MTIEEAYHEYIISIKADGLAAATVKWYQSVLSQFVTAFDGRDVASVTRAEIRAYIAALSERDTRYQGASQKPEQEGGLSAASIESHKRALSAFWNWCDDEYQLDANPMRGIKRKQRMSAHPKSISMDTFRALCVEANEQDEQYRMRDLAILYLLADTGIRASGLVELNINELDMVSRKVIVLEKRMKRRAVPFSAATRLQLIRWFMVRPPDAERVFCGFKVGMEGKALTVSGLNQILKRLAKIAGVKETVSPHRIRHMFAREYLNRGGDLATLSRLMGHEDMNITRDFYAVFTSEETADKHEKFSPVSGDKKQLGE